ncbi:MAG: hypothetical protein ACREUQ_12955 [Burkholderiales bacterium]
MVTRAPRFVMILPNEELAADGRNRRAKRIIYRCPVPDCKRVAVAEDNGFAHVTRKCRDCRAELTAEQVIISKYFRCRPCAVLYARRLAAVNEKFAMHRMEAA